MKRKNLSASFCLVIIFGVLGVSPVYAAGPMPASEKAAGDAVSREALSDEKEPAPTELKATTSSEETLRFDSVASASVPVPFRLPVADPVPGSTGERLAATGKKKKVETNQTNASCGTQEEQLAVCCAAAGISGLLGVDACRRGDMTTALLAGGVFSVLASGVIGGVVGWQYAEAVGMEDTALATQIGAGVGVAGSLLTVGGAMLVLGSGSACMQNCLGCGNTDQTKRPAKKRRRTKRPRRGRSL